MWPFQSRDAEKQSSHPGTPVLDDHQLASAVPQEASTPQQQQEQKETSSLTGWRNERLSMPLVIRAPTLMITSFVCGLSLGTAHGGSKAAYRFRAENAHRLPTTQSGWFLYQKSKNYHAMLGGIKEGVKFGSICTGWATLFLVTEEIVDQSRGRLFARGDDEVALGQRDTASTVVAAMSMAAVYSWKNGLDKFAAARTARIALKYSIIYGLLQDATASLRGDPPAYVSLIARKAFGQKTFFNQLGQVDQGGDDRLPTTIILPVTGNRALSTRGWPGIQHWQGPDGE